MEKADKGLIIEKRLEFILGLFMMLPSIIYVVWLSFQIIYDYGINYDDYIHSYLFIVDNNNGSLKFEITAKRLYAASQRVL